MTDRPRAAHSKIADFAWTFPAAILALIIAGAIGSLLAGLAAPDLIGADGVAGAMRTES